MSVSYERIVGLGSLEKAWNASLRFPCLHRFWILWLLLTNSLDFDLTGDCSWDDLQEHGGGGGGRILGDGFWLKWKI